MVRLSPKDSYHMLFWEEARDQLAVMEQELLSLEDGTGNSETIHSIFRAAHSLKGASATLDIKEMTAVAHALETILSKLKSNEIEISPTVMDVLLSGLDELKRIHEDLFKADSSAAEVMISSGEYTITMGFEPDTELLGLKAFIVINALSEVGEIIEVTPADYETLEDEEFGQTLTIMLKTDQGEGSLSERLDGITDLKDIAILPSPSKVQKAEKSVERSVERSIEKSSLPLPEMALDQKTEKTTVRVNISKINQLINLMGELIIDKEAVNTLAKALKNAYPKDPHVNRLIDVYNHIHYLGSELQEIVLSTRMLPLETIFNKFPRMIRDLSLACQKSIKFTVEGKENGIDRGIIEELVDPLTHLLRNAVDHGIEDSETRIAKGKPATGNLLLSASQGENHILITITDDGKGIDVKKIEQKAIEKGMISIEEAMYMTPSEWMQFIFKPGFSTASVVSEVSGRGVGLDVVKSNLNKINGQIDIWTEVDKGTRFTIKLPLTLAIIKAMLIREDHCTFAIPVSSIVEIIRLKDDEIRERIHRTGYSEILHFRETSIPLITLNQYFELSPYTAETKKLYIIVLGIGEQKMAMVVNEILGEQEIVIKSMGDFIGKDKLFGELEGISGVSILGDGSLAHILDVSAIMKL